MLSDPIKVIEFQEVVSGSRLGSEDVVLDLGCGKGFQTQLLARSCRRAVGVDLSETAIQAAREFLRGSYVESKVEFRAGSVETAGLPDGSFDRVFSFCVLEHITNLPETLRATRSLLRPGGEIHVSVDSLGNISDTDLRRLHSREHHVFQYFTPRSLRSCLEAAGFHVMDVYPILTSELARSDFEERIRHSSRRRPWASRIRFHGLLRSAEKASSANEGIMLVGRAKRP